MARTSETSDTTYGNQYLEPGSRSAELHARAGAVMPGGNTRTTVFTYPYPMYVASASGATITDVDGQTRVDFVNNYTSLIHGHSHPRIMAAAAQQLTNGTAISFPTESEVKLAELLVDRVDSVERIRFTNSGTEAVMMAIQAARAFTGRTKIARFEGLYHGSFPFGDYEVPFNDIDAVGGLLREHADELAAVIVDPLPHRPGFIDPSNGFLERLRELTRQHGVLLISDEIISFRIGYHGPQHRFAYDADLTTLAKIIGGGFPVGAFGGRADVMSVFDPTSGPHPKGERKKRVSHGGTFNANPVTMVAGYEAMTMMTPAEYDRLASLGQRAREGLADLLETRGIGWQVTGQASLFKLHPHPRRLLDYRSSIPTADEEELMSRFYLAMLGQGHVLTPELAGALSTPMTERDVDDLVKSVDRVFETLSVV